MLATDPRRRPGTSELHPATTPRPERRPSPRRVWRPRALSAVSFTTVVSLCAAGCGSSGSSKLSISPSTGAVGTLVHISGNAGPNCVIGQNWRGFAFERSGQKGPTALMEMTTPVATGGSWSATFTVPSDLGGPGTGSQPVGTGRYEVTSTSCQGHTIAKASFQVTSVSPKTSGDTYVGMAVTTDGQGYWLVQADGHVSAYGDANPYGSLSQAPGRSGPVVGIVRTYDNKGYWLASSEGHVYNLGDAKDYGSLPAGQELPAPITGIAATPDGHGYWLVASSGHVYGFGDGRPEGSPTGQFAPYDAITARPAGGYIVTAASNAAAYLFPGDVLRGGGPGAALSATLVGAASSPSGNGAWEAGLDGGVQTIGDANFYGSASGQSGVAKAPVIAMAGSPSGQGYWLLGSDGTVYGFGDAHTFATPNT